MILKIRAIPNDDIKYTENEIEWMHRAIKNLDCFYDHAKQYGSGKSMVSIILRKEQIKSQLEAALLDRRIMRA